MIVQSLRFILIILSYFVITATVSASDNTTNQLHPVLLEPVIEVGTNNFAEFKVTLDASQSTGDITGYKIQIYNDKQTATPIKTLYLPLDSPKITETLPANISYAFYLIITNANINPPQFAITSRILSNFPFVDFTTEPNAERVTLTAKLLNHSSSGGLTYRWLCEECLWKSRDNYAIEETTGMLMDERLDVGTHIIKLLVLDEKQQIVGSAAKVVEIKKNSPPIASFTMTPQEVALGKTPEIKLDAADSIDPDGGKLQYIWTVDSTKGTLEADPTDVTNNAKRIFKPNQSVFNPSLSDATASSSTVDFGFNLTVVDDEPAPQQAISNPSFKVTLPTAQFTIQQNNLVIALDSQGSTGVSFAPAQKASTIQKYEWRLDNVLHYESATDKMVLPAGKHQVSLKLIDSYGYTREIVKDVLATTATVTGTALNAQGGRVNTSSKFAASLPSSTVIAARPIAIPISFQIDAEDVGKAIDLLLVVGIEPPKAQYTGGVETSYYAMVPENVSCTQGLFGYCPVDLYAKPDVWMAQLTEPYERVKTAENNMVRTLSRAFSATGMHYIFAGYRRPDSTIVYSAQPVAQFEVK